MLAIILSLNSTCFASQYSLGAGVGVTPDYEGSAETQTIPMLMLSGRFNSGRSFALTGTKFNVDLIPDRSYSLGPVVNYQMGRSDVDNSQVDAMEDIDGTLEAGISGGIKYNNWGFGFEFLNDILDEHNGLTFQISASYNWEVTDGLSIIPAVSTTYANEDYMETFFGINSGNRGASILPDYSADSGIKDVGANIVVQYSPWERWGLITILSYTVLLNDAKNSPIVESQGDDQQVFLGLMAAYRWGQP